MRRALVLSLVSVCAAAAVFFAGAPTPAHADVFDDIVGALRGLPDGLTDGIRESLQRDVLPTFWQQIIPDMPGILVRGFLMLLGGFARWWIEGLDPIVQTGITQNSLLVQTPRSATVDQADVREMLNAVKVISLLLLAPAVSWSALLVYAGLQDVKTVVANGVAGLAGVLTIDRLYVGAVDVVNALCLAVLGGARGLPGWEAMRTTSVAATAPTATQQALMDGAGVLLYGLVAGLSAVGSLLHLVAVVMFFVCGPLACVFFVVPFLRPAANALFLGFTTAVLVKLLGVITLRLGGAMMASSIGGGGAGSGTGPDAIAWPLLVGIATALAYSTILGRALFFGSGNVLSQGKTAVRTVTTATGGAPDLRSRIATRDAARRARKELTASGGSLPAPTPQMITHSHTHGHLIGRGTSADAAPVPAPAPARPTPATSGATRST